MIVSVKETKSNPYFNLFEEDNLGFLVLSKQSDVDGRQFAPKVYEYNGSIYLMKIARLEKTKISEFDRVKKYIMTSIESIDLDTHLDWGFAEFMLKENKIELD
jgi:N-acylneuraminate cytidylyltransferase